MKNQKTKVERLSDAWEKFQASDKSAQDTMECFTQHVRRY